MEAKRKKSSYVPEIGIQKRLCTSVPSSPATSDLFEYDLREEDDEDVEERITTKTGASFTVSPATSDLFEIVSQHGELSPNTSDLFEEPHHSDCIDEMKSSSYMITSYSGCERHLASEDDDIGCALLEDSDEEQSLSSTDSDINETRFDPCRALVFVYLPESTTDQLRRISSNLKKSGAKVCQFFHKKITHLITSNNCIEREKKERKQVLTVPSSRGALILAKTIRKENNISIFEKAKMFGIQIVLIEQMKFDISSTLEKTSSSKSTTVHFERVQPEVKVRKLREPFLKVVDQSERFRPLVLEMKEWPDALTMFSRGESTLCTARLKRPKKITFCELCSNDFLDLNTHLNSKEHIQNASDPKNWTGVDALISKMPTMEQIIEMKLNNSQGS